MRILVLTSTFPRYANDRQPRFVYDLSNRLAENHHVEVLAPHSPGSSRSEQMGNVIVHRFRYAPGRFETLAGQDGGILTRIRRSPLFVLLLPFFFIGQLIATCRLLRKGRFDLVHAHWIVPQVLVAVMARSLCRRRIPVIGTSHGGDLYGLDSGVMQLVKCHVVRRCDRVTVVSQTMVDDLRRSCRHETPVSVLPMGTDLESLFVPDKNVTRSSTELLFAGRLVEKKGIDVLLDALPAVLASYPLTTLSIVGEGPDEAHLKRRVSELQLGEAVRFFGALPHNELVRCYQAAALAVFPFVVARSGDREGLGLVTVEAMGCECPVIVTDLEAVSDVVERGVTGRVAQRGNATDLARQIIEALSDCESTRQMAITGRKYVAQRYDWSTTVKGFEAIFSAVD